MRHYAWELLKYIIFLNPWLDINEIHVLTWIPLKTIRNWLPRLESSGVISHANVWLPYKKKYYIKSNHLHLFRPKMPMLDKPLEVHVSDDTPVKIWIWDKNMIEYDPIERDIKLNNKVMVEKWSEARYLANKMHKKRKDDQEKWVSTMKIRSEFEGELQKKHIQLEYESAGEAM